MKTRVGGSAALGKGGTFCSGGIHVRGLRGGIHSLTSRDTAWAAAPRVRAVKSSEFGGGKL